MREPLIIDNVDVLATYRVRVTQRGYNTLVQYPTFKAVNVIDWPEEDGVEPDLINPVLAAKDGVTISFTCLDAPAHFDSFIAFLTATSYREYFFKEIGVTARLRLVSYTPVKKGIRLQNFNLTFAFDDSFLEGYEPYEGIDWPLTCNGETFYFNGEMMVFFVYEPGLEPHRHMRHPATGLLLDGEDLSQFGVRLLSGYKAEIEKPAPVKSNVIIESAYETGRRYPDTTVVRGAKDVTLPLLMTADMPTDFWSQYLRLLSVLSDSGYHTLSMNGVSHKFYYKNQQVKEFEKVAGNAMWCKFNLTLCFYEGD